VTHGPRNQTTFALTFHGSGSVELFHQLLDVAQGLHAPLTIFAVGSWLDANPDVAHVAQAAGHELANHTYTHPTLGRLGASAVLSEIERCRDALVRHAGSPGDWFRPSGMETATPLVLTQAGQAGYRTVVGYDVDPRDYQDPGAVTISARVKAGLQAGSIVSLHTGHAGTVAALTPMVDNARQAGLEPVLVRDLLRTS
jgi:peptidoglycan/xylan/chitin deacetylase (PgdA/CDA1 family)